jgi:hypothetical protein
MSHKNHPQTAEEYEFLLLRLQPCPFCGYELEVSQDTLGAYISHPEKSCFLQFSQLFTYHDAEQWNQRRENVSTKLAR